jgi:hypothetical protein
VAPASVRSASPRPPSLRQPAAPVQTKERDKDDDIEAELAALKKRLKG